ncbi:SDR family oxidoreductase [Levilinea saccharolytica]|uniref:NAD-dependent dehydratase n=1 Tax=Levilinea saccharolytica TaxID=229921 RepID=A0A0P6Y269_9CHLR|nr:SDR family oxidoreductase [Levilinea saccharolytica]KPL91757.1 NAD-dependent dehydratase [Levilinea saccharolytica]GAP17552.1 nucleoside-diphosphate-sugar epimerase [Levilinea saccharolytica]
MKVLFIGGTGIISSGCAPLAVERGMELYLMNRGQSFRPPAAGTHLLVGDIRERESALRALGDHTFDAVVNWVAYLPEQVEMDLELFRGRTDQYVFISSASAYQTPPRRLPVTEATVLDNPFWQYSRNKIACEERLLRAYREEKFPVTVVRPSHTYAPSYLPVEGGYSVLDRMLRGEPVIVHGDGTSLWTLTHHTDFARGFLGLLGNSHALGETYHITSDEWLTWDQIHAMIAQAAGTRAKIVHVPSEVIAAFDAEWGASLLGDKAHSRVFDNQKIKRAVPDFRAVIPFSQGVKEIVAWHQAHPQDCKVDAAYNRTTERILAAMRGVRPGES